MYYDEYEVIIVGYYFEELYHKMRDVWFDMPITYDQYQNRYQKDKDESLFNMNKKIRKNLSQIKIDEETVDQKVVNQLMSEIKEFAVKTLGMSSSAVDTIFKEEHFKHSEAFMKRAKKLDASLTAFEDAQKLKETSKTANQWYQYVKREQDAHMQLAMLNKAS